MRGDLWEVCGRLRREGKVDCRTVFGVIIGDED